MRDSFNNNARTCNAINPWQLGHEDNMDPVAYCDLKRAFDRAVRSGDLVTMRSCYAACHKVAREEDRRTGLTPLVAAVQPDAMSIADNVGVLQVWTLGQLTT